MVPFDANRHHHVACGVNNDRTGPNHQVAGDGFIRVVVGQIRMTFIAQVDLEVVGLRQIERRRLPP